jgi:phosphoserine phosphatase RsbU/P
MGSTGHKQTKILVVDDNPINIQVIGNILKEKGYQIGFAMDGQQAINMLRHTHDFYLVLLDINMPIMDGYDTILAIRADPIIAEIPVIFLTSQNDPESVVKCFGYGAQDYITKPFSQEELITRVSTQIEIKKDKDEIKKYIKIIEDKNDLLLKSINYAKSIQFAVLESSQHLSSHFNDQFSLILPKDIVSGDFIWTWKIESKILLGVFDCTGHGVPGAFMSLLFVTFLNEVITIEKIQEPHLILNRLREKVIESLKQKGIANEVNDGMDAAIIKYDPDNEVIHFSGAHNKMYLIRNNEIHVYKGDSMPVSYYVEMPDFSIQKIKVKKGDVIYLFTDGNFDQFGGPYGKKMGSVYFKKILLSHHNKSMKAQEKILLDTHLSWKGNEEQVDDITLVGIRI